MSRLLQVQNFIGVYKNILLSRAIKKIGWVVMKKKSCVNSISISGRRISQEDSPYVIAEISANHNGELGRAKKLIDVAKSSGADAVKLQTYKPDTITLDHDSQDFIIEGGLWNGRSLYDLYSQAYMPWEWTGPLFDHARKIGITIFSSPFDRSAVDLLEDLGAPAYKIASFEAVDHDLIGYVAKTGKPVIISTGMANDIEIQEAIDVARSAGCKELAILHCVSGYPAAPSDYNLRTVTDMIGRFGCVTGLSDHTLDNTTAIASIALGASIVEKHFTIDRSHGGPDDSFSLEPQELENLCDGVKTVWSSLGKVNYGLKSSEMGNIKLRRSLYFVRDLSIGDIITRDDVRSIRPGFGLAPKFLDQVIGATVSRDVNYGHPVTDDSYLRVHDQKYKKR